MRPLCFLWDTMIRLSNYAYGRAYSYAPRCAVFLCYFLVRPKK